MYQIVKNLFAIGLIILLFNNLAEAQGVQAGISASYDTLIISAKPAVNFTGQNYSAGNITIMWQTANNVTLGTPIQVVGPWVSDPAATNLVSGAFTYTTFNFVAGTAIPLTWTAGNEYVLFKVLINQTGSGMGDFDLANPGFASGVDWYFESNGDSTNNTTNFYVSSASALLPVELTAFTASPNERHINLQWTTATEKNSHMFEVEKFDNKAWKKVGEVAAGGNTNAPKEYSYVDKLTAVNGDSVSYRLKMVDNEGKFIYSTEAKVKAVPTVFALEQNYPNPFNPETKIQFSIPQDARVSLKIYDITGREIATVVNEDRKAGYYEEKFGGYRYSSGVYFYRIIAETNGKVAFTKVKKMMMIK